MGHCSTQRGHRPDSGTSDLGQGFTQHGQMLLDVTVCFNLTQSCQCTHANHPGVQLNALKARHLVETDDNVGECQALLHQIDKTRTARHRFGVFAMGFQALKRGVK